MAFTYTGEYVNLGHGRGWLNRPAANSLFRLDARLGRPWGINEAGRTWDQQNDHYQRYLRYGSPIALSPDAPSLHQVGNAIDTNDRITWLLNEYGWFHTVYRWVNGVWTLVEEWHYEYFPARDQHINEPASGGSTAFPIAPKEDEMAYPIRVDKAHLFLLSPGQVKHFSDEASATITRNIVTVNDAWIDLSATHFVEQLDSFGIPRDKVDTVNGLVFDVSQGKMVQGGVWSWARDAASLSASILEKLNAAPAPEVKVPKA